MWPCPLFITQATESAAEWIYPRGSGAGVPWPLDHDVNTVAKSTRGTGLRVNLALPPAPFRNYSACVTGTYISSSPRPPSACQNHIRTPRVETRLIETHTRLHKERNLCDGGVLFFRLRHYGVSERVHQKTEPYPLPADRAFLRGAVSSTIHSPVPYMRA